MGVESLCSKQSASLTWLQMESYFIKKVNYETADNLSIASPSEIERTARQLRVIREEFLTTGALAMYTPRSIILESWQRCNDLQVNPSRRCAPLAIAREAQLSNLRNANELLRLATR